MSGEGVALAATAWLIALRVSPFAALMWTLFGTSPLLLVPISSLALGAAFTLLCPTTWGPPPLATVEPGFLLVAALCELSGGAIVALCLFAPLFSLHVASALTDHALWGQTLSGHGPASRLYVGLGLSLWGAMFGLPLLTDLLAESLLVYPPGSLVPRAGLAPWPMVRLLTWALQGGLLLAAPLLLAQLFLTLSLSLAGRLWPALQAALLETAPLRLLALLSVLLLSLAAVGPALELHTVAALGVARALLGSP